MDLANKCNTDTGVCQCGDTGSPCDASSQEPKCLGPDGATATLQEGDATCQVRVFPSYCFFGLVPVPD